MEAFGNSINNAFFFLIDVIIRLQIGFIGHALSIARIVLLIAILTAALNYALTGQGLKDNVIKIAKATIFFFIIVAAFPTIIGAITNWTFHMAESALMRNVQNYFDSTFQIIQDELDGIERIDRTEYRFRWWHIVSPAGALVQHRRANLPYREQQVLISRHETILLIMDQRSEMIANLTQQRDVWVGEAHMQYNVVAPAALMKLIFSLAEDSFRFASRNDGRALPNFTNIIIGIICGFFILFTGILGLLEYVICFLEFMLVACVGVILLPLAIWDGSKFMAESYIKAMIGFFLKLLFCTLAILLLVYGYVSMFMVLFDNPFEGSADQIAFIIFSSLLFLLICKAAPGMAQSLVTGSPSLTASGAIQTAMGAGAAALAVGKLARTASGGTLKTGLAAGNILGKAGAAAGAVSEAGGTFKQQAGAFAKSLGTDAVGGVKAGALGLTRSLMGMDTKSENPHSTMDRFGKHKNADGTTMSYGQLNKESRLTGENRGKQYVNDLAAKGKTGKNNQAFQQQNLTSENRNT